MRPEERALWQAADAELDRLLDLSPTERQNALLGMQPALQARVQRLLSAHAAQGPLDTPLPEPGARVPARIGDWRIGEELGRGGMAVVYAAERDVAGGAQRGALKLLTVGALAADGRRRFLREQAVLARLDHPRIAALLDAGVLPDGTPWLVMQRIDGERIDRWVRQRRVLPRRIVQLGLQLCEAVAYAQRRLVVHRDLKPGNILVDGDGGVRLLDFGIARLLDEAGSVEATATAMRVLTPQYAAPEQFRGEDSGTAVDVFGLGAVLHHLLTGQPARGGAEFGTRRLRPSRLAAESGALEAGQRGLFERELRGDLEAILLCALDPEPARRYPDAAALADDLRRWLEQRPVRAARAGRLHLAALFLRRHRAAAGFAAVLALSIGLGLGATFWQAQRAQQQAGLAAAQAERATAAREFLVSLFLAADPLQTGGVVRDTGEVFRRAAERLRADPGLPPELRLELLATAAEVQRSLGEHADALATLDIADALAQDKAGSVDTLVLGKLRMERAHLLSLARELEPAVAKAEEVLALLASRQDAPARSKRASALLAQAEMLTQLNRGAEARVALDRARADLAGIDPPPYEQWRNLESSLGHLAYVSDDIAGAYAHMQRAYAYQQHLGNEHAPSNMHTLNNLAAIAAMLGRLDEALDYDRRALDLARAAYPPGNPAIARALYSLGDTLRQRGRFDEAMPLLDEALAVHRGADDAGQAALTQMVRLRVLVSLDRMEEALALSQELLPQLAQRWGATSREMALALEQSLAAAARRGERRRLAGLEEEAEALLREADDQGWNSLAQLLRWRLGENARTRGDAARARHWLQQALSGPEGSVDAIATVALRLESLALRLHPEQADALAGALRHRLETAKGASQDALVDAWLALAESAQDRGEPEAAQAALQAAARIVHEHPPAAALIERYRSLADA
jgi:eukaryotic-like serine/threonine-protein kinase